MLRQKIKPQLSSVFYSVLVGERHMDVSHGLSWFAVLDQEGDLATLLETVLLISTGGAQASLLLALQQGGLQVLCGCCLTVQ